MGYIKFKPYDEAKIKDKIDTLLKLTHREFSDEILSHTIGFFISSPNMDRKINTISPQNPYSIFYSEEGIQNFCFRLQLDDWATDLLNGNAIVLKGDLIFNRSNNNYVKQKDFYLVDNTDKLPHEYFIGGSACEFNGDNLITMDLAKEIPFITDKMKFDEFIGKWYKYLDFEKTITVENIKSYPIMEKIDYKQVYEVIDNAVNREKYNEHIIKEYKGNLFIDKSSPKLSGDEVPFLLFSIRIVCKEFGSTKEEILKKANSFACLGLSIIREYDSEKLNNIRNILSNNSREKMHIPKSFDFEDWLNPDFEKGIVTFYFLINNENPKDVNIPDFIRDEDLRLAYIAIGDISLHKRSEETLDRLKIGDVKNTSLAGILSEPEKFDTGTDKFPKDNIQFAMKNLNLHQKEAIIKCLNSNSIFLLQGPPGTGKTQTITEIVYQFNTIGKKVLLSSQTHIAIDNVIERLPKELNVLPIRLVRDRVKANERYLPDKILDNFYDAAYNKYHGKMDDYDKYEKNIVVLTRSFEDNKARFEKLEKRLKEVKKSEEKHNQLKKELYDLKAKEIEIEQEYEILKQSIKVFENYFRTKLPFEQVNEYNYAPLTEQFNKLAEEYHIKQEDDLYCYAVSFKRIAGKKRIEHLKILLSGREKPEDLIQVEKEIKDLEKEIDIFEKYGNPLPSDLRRKINSALEKKQKLDRKYEEEGVKIPDFSKEKLYFASDENNGEKTIIEMELYEIKKFIDEYNDILAQVLCKEKYDKLTDKEDQFETQLKSIEYEIERTCVAIKKIEAEICSKKTPIKEELRQLDEYFNEFFIGKLNGAALPETEDEKFEEIKKYLEQEKNNFEEYKVNFKKLQGIYESLVKYLEGRDRFVETQREKYTQDLLKSNANVYGITCTSKQKFQSKDLVGGNNIAVNDLDIQDIDFDVVIIDEVSKATPIEILIPIILGKSVILVGDQRQLPPIFKYRENMFEGKTEEEKAKILQGEASLDYFRKMIENSLFEEIFNKLKHNKAILTEQYRFNEAIMKCVNVFYDGKLTLGAGKEQNNKKKHYLDVSIKSKERDIPIFCKKKSTYWFDSHSWADGTPAYSEVRDGETSYRNMLEVKLTVELLLLLERGYGELKKNNPEEYKMTSADGDKPSVAVISMYGKQINSIKMELKKRNIKFRDFKSIKIEISTVDNYQGKEQDIVLVNMVANTKSHRSGEFLKKFNRINVAISRARTMLIMIGSKTYYESVSVNVPNMDTGKDNFINAYYKIFEQCEGKWIHTAKILDIKKEINKK